MSQKIKSEKIRLGWYHLVFCSELLWPHSFYSTFWKFPRWLYNILLAKIYPVQEKQATYPILFWLTRMTYLVTRTFSHIRFMDFSLLPGRVGHVLWKLGIIRFWQRFILPHYDLSQNTKKKNTNILKMHLHRDRERTKLSNFPINLISFI